MTATSVAVADATPPESAGLRSTGMPRSRRWIAALQWVGYTVAVPVVLVVIWQLWASKGASFYWPTPLAIIKEFPGTWFGSRFLGDVVPSLGRLLVGYVIALVIGVIAGFFVGSVRRLRYLLDPVLELFRAIPPPVLVPIVMLFTGIGQELQITVLAFGCIWPVLLNTAEGVRGMDLTQIDTAKSYHIAGWRRVTKLTLPGAAPKIFTGARQALSMAIIMMVIGEMFAATNGIGYNLIQFQRLFALTDMWTGIVLLGIIGVVANGVLVGIEHRVLRWYRGMQAQER